MKKLCFLKALAAVLALSATLCTNAQTPKREMRSAWVAGMGIDWPRTKGTTAKAQTAAKNEMIAYLDKFKAQNFTGICLHVRPRADAYYKSTLEPWSGDVSGTRGTNPGWDPLAFVIEECHKRGMECYAWINPYRVNTSTEWTTDFDKQWKADGIIFKNVTWTVFNPGLPAARKHCLDVMTEIYTNYDVDGMLFDDYFYPGDKMPTTVDASADGALYKASGTTMSLGDWRRNNVNTFVKELYDRIQAARPDMRFGIGPAGVGGASASKYGLSKPKVSSSDWMYDDIYCDPLAWMNDRSIDFISPQIYWGTSHSSAPFEPLAKWWSDVAAHFGIHNYVSIAAYRMKESDFGGSVSAGSKEIGKQVDICRNTTLNNASGQIYYNTVSINGPSITGLGDYLGANKYTRPALVPVVTWKTPVKYAAPAGVNYSSGTLTWDATQRQGRTIMRYTVYAIPESKTLEEAQAADGDGLDGEYLLDVSYGTSYTIPSAKQKGYWYAVCVYDGYGNESEPGLYGYSAEPSEVPNLMAPADGVRVGWDVPFAWSSVTGAQFHLQVAYDKDFTRMLADRTTTSNTLTLSLDNIPESTTLWWRVASTQPGKLLAYSAVRSFVSPKAEVCTAPTLLSPVSGEAFSGLDVPLKWKYADKTGIERVTIEVFRDLATGDPVYTAQTDATATEYSLRTSALGEGNFVWRLRASGPRVLEALSATGSFTLENLATGATEPGYEVKTDPATYEKQGNLILESLWTRSAHAPYSNHTFESNGSLNRGMVATPTHVYVSGRSENSATADIFLDEYSAFTGEHVRKINLSEAGKMRYYPCNDVIKDTEGNILITNLSLNISSDPLYIFKVDTDNSDLTQVARLTYSGGGRCDHLGVYGDVTTGNFTVFAAVASSATLLRWKVINGTAGTAEAKTIGTFYPASASNFGIAPKVRPVSTSRLYIDGNNTAMTLYDFDKATVVGSFANAKDLAPVNVDDNGSAQFAIGDTKYAVYSAEPANEAQSFSAGYHLVNAGANDDFSGMSHLWSLPDDGLGGVRSTTCSAPVDAVSVSPKSAHVYVYSPGNGLAAYRVTDTSITAVEDLNAAAAPVAYHVDGRNVIFEDAINATAYTIAGQAVASTRTGILTLPASGVYLVRTPYSTLRIYVR